MWTTISGTRTFKTIDDNGSIICIDNVIGITIERYAINMWRVRFYFGAGEDDYFSSDIFDTKEEAIKFRNEIMGFAEVQDERDRV